jgi:hypothetical protein
VLAVAEQVMAWLPLVMGSEESGRIEECFGVEVLKDSELYDVHWEKVLMG